MRTRIPAILAATLVAALTPTAIADGEVRERLQRR